MTTPPALRDLLGAIAASDLAAALRLLDDMPDLAGARLGEGATR